MRKRNSDKDSLCLTKSEMVTIICFSQQFATFDLIALTVTSPMVITSFIFTILSLYSLLGNFSYFSHAMSYYYCFERFFT